MIAALLPLIGTVLEKILPDQKASDEAKLRVMELAQRGELAGLEADVKLALGQLEVNKAEAATDLFRGGWRPAVGWCCAAGLVYTFLLQPILPWALLVFGKELPALPPLDGETLMTLLLGMLGLGGLRSYEKIRGAAK